ncbi:MAG: DUF4115 domain-containing protein [Pseudomonadota bacterium]|nr:DUF4115 domain-containing protein [Pseudomonadota bacterium]
MNDTGSGLTFDVPSAGLPSAGAQLRAQREARGWSIPEVADQLNLAPRQIEAIEADNHAALPGMAVTRGFMRSYAKLLKIDATALLAELSGPTQAMPASVRRALPHADFSDSRAGHGSRRERGSRWVTVATTALSLVIVLAALVYFGLVPPSVQPLLEKAAVALGELRAGSRAAVEPPSVAGTTVAVGDSITEPISGNAVQAAQPSADVTASSAAANPSSMPPAGSIVAAAPPAPLPMSATPASVSPAAIAPTAIVPATPTPAGTTATAGVPGDGANTLVLTMRADSWVELKGPGKSKSAARLLRAGTTESFDITAPVLLVVGNAAGVDATLRGKPLPLRSGSNNNVARIKLQ